MEEQNYYRNYGYKSGRIGFAILLVLTGFIFLGLNSGLIPGIYRPVLISWQMLLIVIGIWQMIKGHFFNGTLTALFGVFFIIPKIVRAFPDAFPGISDNFTALYWPFLLIAAGILALLSVFFRPKWYERYHYRRIKSHRYNHYKHYHDYHYSNIHDKFSKSNVFSSGEHIVLDPEFKGGEINSVFGNTLIDLRKTNLQEGNTFLEINVVFGGVTIVVPESWYIELHVDTVFGGLEDKRFSINNLDTSKKLIIEGSCVFGGGELRN